VTVPPVSAVTVDTSADASVPAGGYAVTARSANSVPVVVERVVGYGPPTPRQATPSTLGAARAASRWIVAAGADNARSDEVVTVMNPGPDDAVVDVVRVVDGRLEPLEGLSELDIAAGERRRVRIVDPQERDRLALAVDATAPVVVTRAWFPDGGAQASISLGVPVIDLGAP
jgi:hypothetical protein